MFTRSLQKIKILLCLQLIGLKQEIIFLSYQNVFFYHLFSDYPETFIEYLTRKIK
jgi:hypothetical protein